MADIFAVPSLAGNVTIRGLGDNYSAAASTLVVTSTLVATNEDGPLFYKPKRPARFRGRKACRVSAVIAITTDPLSWGAGAACEAAKNGNTAAGVNRTGTH